MSKWINKQLLFALVIAVGNVVSAPSFASEYDDISHKAANNFYDAKQSQISPQRAASLAKRHQPGRVLSIKPREKRGGYHVRMLVDGGRVVTVKVDAKGRVTGR